jgi:hypothetical protein
MDRVPRIKNKSNISDTNTRIPELKAVLKAKGKYHNKFTSTFFINTYLIILDIEPEELRLVNS